MTLVAAMTAVTAHLATPERWPDLERLFGPNDANSLTWHGSPNGYWSVSRQQGAGAIPLAIADSLMLMADII